MTQTQRLIAWLESGKGIDPLTAWTELGIYRLSARIFDAKASHPTIKKTSKQVFNRYGEKFTVAWYTLQPIDNSSME